MIWIQKGVSKMLSGEWCYVSGPVDQKCLAYALILGMHRIMAYCYAE